MRSTYPAAVPSSQAFICSLRSNHLILYIPIRLFRIAPNVTQARFAHVYISVSKISLPYLICSDISWFWRFLLPGISDGIFPSLRRLVEWCPLVSVSPEGFVHIGLLFPLLPTLWGIPSKSSFSSSISCVRWMYSSTAQFVFSLFPIRQFLLSSFPRLMSASLIRIAAKYACGRPYNMSHIRLSVSGR